jgi:N-acetylglutamate synthase-like GNAT family acetyltransferase
VNDQRAFSVRKATRSDKAGILECLRTAFEPYRDRYTPEAFLNTVLTIETLEQRLARMSDFVAVSGAGEVVGTVGCSCVDEKDGHIRGMAVRPAWQRCGVATELLKATEAQLRDGQCALITLDTTEPLDRAMRLYEEHGFRRSGKITDLFGMPLIEYVKNVT